MAILSIMKIGNPVLTKTCEPIVKVDHKTKKLIKNMFETMYKSGGCGLAAPQVGITKRIIVIDITGGDRPILMINPKIIEANGEQIDYEGCLSVPGKAGMVLRPHYVKVQAYNENMESFELEGTGLLARVICHELDHLDGHLYIEKIVNDLVDTMDIKEEKEYDNLSND